MSLLSSLYRWSQPLCSQPSGVFHVAHNSHSSQPAADREAYKAVPSAPWKVKEVQCYTRPSTSQFTQKSKTEGEGSYSTRTRRRCSLLPRFPLCNLFHI